MAIIPSVTKSSESSDAQTLYLVSDTGAYSSTNTGGFGAPNPLYSSVIQWDVDIYARNSTTLLSTLSLTGSTSPTAANFANPSSPSTASLNASYFGGSAGDEITDNVYTCNSYVYTQQGSAGNFTYDFTNGSTTVSINDAIILPTYSDYQYILAPDGERYEIDSFDGGDIILVSAYQGSTVTDSASFKLGWYAQSNFACIQQCQNCMLTLIGTEAVASTFPTNNCTCSKARATSQSEYAFNLYYTAIEGGQSKQNWDWLQRNIEYYLEAVCNADTNCNC